MINRQGLKLSLAGLLLILTVNAWANPQPIVGFSAPALTFEEEVVNYGLTGASFWQRQGSDEESGLGRFVLNKTSDFDGDGIADLLVRETESGIFSQNNLLHISGVDGSLIRSFDSLLASQEIATVTSAVEIGDLDNDTIVDFAIGNVEFDALENDGITSDGRVLFISGADLSVIAEVYGDPDSTAGNNPPPFGVFSIGEQLGFDLVSADFNGDGVSDVISFNGSGRLVMISGADFSKVYEVDPPFLDNGTEALLIFANSSFIEVIGDVNQDGSEDYAFVHSANTHPTGATNVVSIISGIDGSSLLTVPSNTGEILVDVTSPDDLNGDAIPDIVLTVSPISSPEDFDFETPQEWQNGSIRAYSSTDGSVLYSTPVDGMIIPVPGGGMSSAGDLNTDGTGDVLVQTIEFELAGADPFAQSVVYGYSGSDGSLLYKLESENIFNPNDFLDEFEGFGLEIVPIGDLDNDGSTDIVVSIPGAEIAGQRFGRISAYLTTIPAIEGVYQSSLSPFELSGLAYDFGFTSSPAITFISDGIFQGGFFEVLSDDTFIPIVDGLTNYNIALVQVDPTGSGSTEKATVVTDLDQASLLSIPGFVSVDAFISDYYLAQGFGLDYSVASLTSVPEFFESLPNVVTRIIENRICRAQRFAERGRDRRVLPTLNHAERWVRFSYRRSRISAVERGELLEWIDSLELLFVSDPENFVNADLGFGC